MNTPRKEVEISYICTLPITQKMRNFKSVHGFISAWGKDVFISTLLLEEKKVWRWTDTYTTFASVYIYGDLRVSDCDAKKHK
jgi:hypothetical protein